MTRWWQYFKFGSFVLQWAASAAADGVISKDELLAVVEQGIKVFGKDIKVKIS